MAGGSSDSSLYITYSDVPLGVFSCQGDCLVPDPFTLISAPQPPCSLMPGSTGTDGIPREPALAGPQMIANPREPALAGIPARQSRAWPAGSEAETRQSPETPGRIHRVGCHQRHIQAV